MSKKGIVDSAVRAEGKDALLKEKAPKVQERVITDLVAYAALERAIEEGENSGYLDQFDFDSHLNQLQAHKNGPSV